MKFNRNNAKNSGIHEASIQLGREDCMVLLLSKNMEWIFFSVLPILTKTTKDCPQFLISKIFLKLFFVFCFSFFFM